MRELALWASGAAVAFFVTAGAFLMLANLATGSSEEELTPDAGRGNPGSVLDLDLNEDRLASLEAEPDQELYLTMQNTGSRDFSNVNLTLEASSGDTALPRTRFYRYTVRNLAAGESFNVRFVLDLSDGEGTTGNAPEVATEPQKILEIRATTPGGISAVRTVILSL